MKALVLKAQRPIEEQPLLLEDLLLPEPGPGQIRLKVTACGVCRTDLHEIEGDLEVPKIPVVPGHQIVGRVDALGTNVAKFKEGGRAGAVWLYRTCRECEFCRSGRENLCDNAEFTGFHHDGGFAEYMVVDEDFAYRLPEGISDEQAAPLLCGGVIGYRAFSLSRVQPGQTLGLYGFGNSAHITIQVARHKGCRVLVFTRTPSHQEHALHLGAEWAGTADDEPPEKIDSAIIFAPAGELVPKALEVLNKGGTIACAGIHMSNIPEMPYQLIYWEKGIRSVANSTRRDARELLELAAEIPIETKVTTFPLEEANEALLAMKESRLDGDAVLLPYDEGNRCD